jgi:hypothetical protein
MGSEVAPHGARNRQKGCTAIRNLPAPDYRPACATRITWGTAYSGSDWRCLRPRAPSFHTDVAVPGLRSLLGPAEPGTRCFLLQFAARLPAPQCPRHLPLDPAQLFEISGPQLVVTLTSGGRPTEAKLALSYRVRCTGLLLHGCACSAKFQSSLADGLTLAPGVSGKAVPASIMLCLSCSGLKAGGSSYRVPSCLIRSQAGYPVFSIEFTARLTLEAWHLVSGQLPGRHGYATLYATLNFLAVPRDPVQSCSF